MKKELIINNLNLGYEFWRGNDVESKMLMEGTQGIIIFFLENIIFPPFKKKKKQSIS